MRTSTPTRVRSCGAARWRLSARDFKIPDTPLRRRYCGWSAAGPRRRQGAHAPRGADVPQAISPRCWAQTCWTTLEPLWQRFLRLRDDDYAGMVEVAAQWLEALDEDPEDDVSGMVGRVDDGREPARRSGRGRGRGQDGEGEGGEGDGTARASGTRSWARSHERRVQDRQRDRRGSRGRARRAPHAPSARPTRSAARRAEGPHAEAFKHRWAARLLARRVRALLAARVPRPPTSAVRPRRWPARWRRSTTATAL